MSYFLNEKELAELGLKSYGKNILIGRHVVLYTPEQLTLGDNVRIDDFTIISGNVTMGSFIHVSQFCGIYGGDEGITMEDFSGLSAKCSVYAVSDDYTGLSMTNLKSLNRLNKSPSIRKNTISLTYNLPERSLSPMSNY